MNAVTYSQNPRNLGLFLVILGSAFIAISAYFALFEDFSWPALWVGLQTIVMYKNSQRLKYSIKIDDQAISYSMLGKKERINLSDITNLNIKLFEIHIEKHDGETSILNLEVLKDKELQKIKSSFRELKEELPLAA
jgi:hypothetical protein